VNIKLRLDLLYLQNTKDSHCTDFVTRSWGLRYDAFFDRWIMVDRPSIDIIQYWHEALVFSNQFSYSRIEDSDWT
jgi:hypothetical protein